MAINTPTDYDKAKFDKNQKQKTPNKTAPGTTKGATPSHDGSKKK